MAVIRKNKEKLEQLLRTEMVQTVFELIEQGEPITMDEVAKRCGVAKGTLYNYFGSKDELLDHVHTLVLEPLLTSHRQNFESDREPMQKLHNFIDSVLCTYERISTYFRFSWQNKTADIVFREQVEGLIDPLAQLCRQGIEQNAFVKVDPYILADMIYGTVIGPLKTSCYRDASTLDIEAVRQDMRTLIDKIVSLDSGVSL